MCPRKHSWCCLKCWWEARCLSSLYILDFVYSPLDHTCPLPLAIWYIKIQFTFHGYMAGRYKQTNKQTNFEDFSSHLWKHSFPPDCASSCFLLLTIQPIYFLPVMQEIANWIKFVCCLFQVVIHEETFWKSVKNIWLKTAIFQVRCVNAMYLTAVLLNDA